MQKKGIVALVLLAVMVAFSSWAASTWQIQTKLVTSGDVMKVRDKANQTAVGTTVFNNYTTSADIPVVVTPSTGYTIAAITKSGTPVTINSSNSSVPYTAVFHKADGVNQSLTASFTPSQPKVTAIQPAGGTISPTQIAVTYNG